jgi:hypothetical protein
VCQIEVPRLICAIWLSLKTNHEILFQSESSI